MKKFFLLCLLLVGGLCFAVWLIFQAQDMENLGGRSEADRATRPVDVPALIETAALRSRQSVVLTEREVNTWLANQVRPVQEGVLSDKVKLTGVWLRFEKTGGGRCEIILEREIDGKYPQTVSLFVKVERKKKANGTYTTQIRKDGGNFLGFIPIGGRFGQLTLPQGFLLFTSASFDALTTLFQQELELIEQGIIRRGGGKISFEDGEVHIDFPSED